MLAGTNIPFSVFVALVCIFCFSVFPFFVCGILTPRTHHQVCPRAHHPVAQMKVKEKSLFHDDIKFCQHFSNFVFPAFFEFLFPSFPAHYAVWPSGSILCVCVCEGITFFAYVTSTCQPNPHFGSRTSRGKVGKLARLTFWFLRPTIQTLFDYY